MRSPLHRDAVAMLQALRAARRRFVKKHGKHALRGLGAFLGRQSRVGDPTIFEGDAFPWTRDLAREWLQIRDEACAILARREELPGFAELSPDQYKIAEAGWKTYFFFAFGNRDDEALAACPATARLLATVPGLETAFYSVLPPRAHVRAHRGVTKGIVRGHLGLVVPGEPGDCRIRIGEETRSWAEGELLLFDDTVLHEVWNDTDHHRVVLLFDFRRPMRWAGATLSSLFIRGIKRTGYVRDGLRNHARWKEAWHAPAPRPQEPPASSSAVSRTTACRSSSDGGISG